MRRHLVLLFVAAAAATALVRPASHARAAATAHVVLDQIDGFRRATWRWQSLMGVSRTPTRYAERRAGRAYRAWVLRLWERRAAVARRQAANPPHASAWRCIQRYEAPWHAATGNGYYGGLQMDIGFQQRYGADLMRRKGLAHLWTPLEQMWVAERAYRAGRGFWPWPNTARMCGVL